MTHIAELTQDGSPQFLVFELNKVKGHSMPARQIKCLIVSRESEKERTKVQYCTYATERRGKKAFDFPDLRNIGYYSIPKQELTDEDIILYINRSPDSRDLSNKLFPLVLTIVRAINAYEKNKTTIVVDDIIDNILLETPELNELDENQRKNFKRVLQTLSFLALLESSNFESHREYKVIKCDASLIFNIPASTEIREFINQQIEIKQKARTYVFQTPEITKETLGEELYSHYRAAEAKAEEATKAAEAEKAEAKAAKATEAEKAEEIERRSTNKRHKQRVLGLGGVGLGAIVVGVSLYFVVKKVIKPITNNRQREVAITGVTISCLLLLALAIFSIALVIYKTRDPKTQISEDSNSYEAVISELKPNRNK